MARAKQEFALFRGVSLLLLRIPGQGCRSRQRDTKKISDLLGLTAVAAFLFLEVAEDRARIDAQVAGRLGAVAGVEAQHLVDVLALPLLPRLGQRQDGGELVGV